MAPRSTLPRPPRRRNRRRHQQVRTPGRDRPEQGPVAGTMDQVRPHHVQRRHTAIARLLGWPADPYQTPSGGGHRADPGQKRDTGGRMGSKRCIGRAGKTSDPSGCPRVALYATTLKGKPPRRWPLATLDRGRIQRRRGLRPGRENGASAEPENQEMTVREPRSNGIDTGRPVTEARDNRFITCSATGPVGRRRGAFRRTGSQP